MNLMNRKQERLNSINESTNKDSNAKAKKIAGASYKKSGSKMSSEMYPVSFSEMRKFNI